MSHHRPKLSGSSEPPMGDLSRGSLVHRKIDRKSRVSFRKGVGDSHHSHHDLSDEGSITDHFEISQWPPADPLVSKLKSHLKTERSAASGSSIMHVTACHAFFSQIKCFGKKSINGIMEGPRVKIKTDIPPVDYFALYKGAIKAQSKAIIGLDGSTTYTYEELNTASDHMANSIKAIVEQEMKSKFYGLTKESIEFEPCVGLSIEPCEKSVIVILAIWKLGLPYLPIRTAQTPVKRIATIIETVRPILIIGSLNDSILIDSAKGKCRVVCVSQLYKTVLGETKEALKGKRSFNKRERETSLKIDDLDVFFFRAKRRLEQKCHAILYKFNGEGHVMTTYIRSTTIWNRVHAEWKLFPYGKNEVCGLYSSLDSHEFLGQFLAPLLGGISLAVMNVHDFYTFLERVKKSKIDRLMIFPELLRALVTVMELQRTNVEMCPQWAPQIPSFFDCVEYWFCTGAAIRRHLAISFFQCAPKKAKLVNLFGSRETLSFVCMEVFKSLKDVKEGNFYDILPMGRPVMNTRLYILETDGSVAENSGLGEIYLTGLGVNRKSLSEYKKSFTDVRQTAGPCTLPNIHISQEESEKGEDESFSMFRTLLKTTDYGKLVYGNQRYRFPFCCRHKVTLEFAGTSESELIVENYRVNVDEIITYLKQFPDVKSCHVVVYRPGTASTVILAFVVVSHPKPTTKEELHVHLRERIPEYMMPTIVLVSGIPVKNFKVDGSSLCEQFQKERQMRHGLQGMAFHSDDDFSRTRRSIEYVTARTMFRIFFYVCGVGEDWTSSHLNWTLGELHIPFTFLPDILYQLFRHGYYVDMRDLFSVKTAKQVLNLMMKHFPTDPSDVPDQQIYESEIIEEAHWHEILQFYLHGNCGAEYKHSIAHYCEMKQKDVELIIKGVWPLVVQKPHSVCIRNKKTGKIVAALLCTDHYVKMSSQHWEKLTEEHPTKYRLQIIDQVDETLESLHLINHKNPKNALQVLFFVMDPNYMKSYEDSVQILNLMFSQLLEIGSKAGFACTYVTIFDYVTATFVEETFKYQLIEYRQTNMFKAKDLTKPFHLAPDNVIGAVLHKTLGHS